MELLGDVEPFPALSFKQIIANYEAKEEEFLNELQTMTANCTNNVNDSLEINGFNKTESDGQKILDGSQPVLGTLCLLISEIQKLRYENKQLRLNISDNNLDKTKQVCKQLPLPTCRRGRSFVGSSLESTPNQPLSSTGNTPSRSRFFSGKFGATAAGDSSGSSSGFLLPRRPPIASVFKNRGVQEKLSSPPPQKDNLNISAYSADVSSDAYSSYRLQSNAATVSKPKANCNTSGNSAAYVVPKSDHHVVHASDLCDLSGYDQQSENSRHSSLIGFRRSKRSLLSLSPFSGTTSSASSSIDLNFMSMSRSSIMELFGFGKKRRNRQQEHSSAPATDRTPKVEANKRYSVVSVRETENDKDETSLESFLSSSIDRRERNLLAGFVKEIRNSEPSNLLKKTGSSADVFEESHEKVSVKNKYAPSQSCNNNNSERKERPRPTSVYLEPSVGRQAENSMWTFGINPKALFKRSSSDKIRLSKGASEIREKERRLRDENAALRCEMHALKNRNARLIEQLREKSSQLSKLHGHADNMENQLKQNRQTEAERKYRRSQIDEPSEKLFREVENQLRTIKDEIQRLKNDAYTRHHIVN